MSGRSASRAVAAGSEENPHPRSRLRRTGNSAPSLARSIAFFSADTRIRLNMTGSDRTPGRGPMGLAKRGRTSRGLTANGAQPEPVRGRIGDPPSASRGARPTPRWKHIRRGAFGGSSWSECGTNGRAGLAIGVGPDKSRDPSGMNGRITTYLTEVMIGLCCHPIKRADTWQPSGESRISRSAPLVREERPPSVVRFHKLGAHAGRPRRVRVAVDDRPLHWRFGGSYRRAASRSEQVLGKGLHGDEHVRLSKALCADVEAMFRDIRARQEASGREYVRLPARRTTGAKSPETSTQMEANR